jgi:gliding motility-associated-like protein
MKKLFTILAAITPLICLSQNLVPNPDFETYNTCPNTLSCINYSPTYSAFTWVTGWVNPMVGSSSDYFNTCATATCGVPSNTFGYQVPRSGKAYIGGYAYLAASGGSSSVFYSEYAECKLNSPLVAGKTYAVSFYVNMIMFPGSAGSYNYIGVDRLGAHFSDTLIYDASTNNHLKLSYDIVNPAGNFLTDTLQWMKVSGFYKAKGGEQYMVMGTFEDGNPITFQQVYPTTANPASQNLCYYFYDDISVVLGCDTNVFMHDTTACAFDPISIKLKSTAGPGSKLWSTGDKTPTIIAGKSGAYWCVTTDGCSVKLDTFYVRAFKNIDANVSYGYLCKDTVFDPVILTSAVDTAIYNWSTGAHSNHIGITEPGDYWCQAIKDCNLHIDTFHFKRYKDYIDRDHDSVVCLLKKPFFVELYSEPGAEKYAWSTRSYNSDAEKYIWSTNGSAPLITVTDTGMSASRAIKDCMVFTDTFKLWHRSFNDKPDLGPDRVICKDEPYNANLGIRFNAVPFYKWSTGDTNCCITMQETGSYTLTITDGCTSAFDSVAVEFIDDCNQCLFIPSAFTPNNDGLNDKFRCIPKCELRSYSLRIYSRFGERLFGTDNIDYRWDGTYKGQDLPIGTYFYEVTYITLGNDKTYLKKGDITLIR